MVEYPFIPSIPVPGGGGRLFLAEGVAAVIEVKSDLAGQWNEAKATAASVHALQRNINPTLAMSSSLGATIPVFAVGYKGWKSIDTAVERLLESDLSGVLMLENGIFIAKPEFFGGIKANGAYGMWTFIAVLHEAMSHIKMADPSLLAYCKPDTRAVAP